MPDIDWDSVVRVRVEEMYSDATGDQREAIVQFMRESELLEPTSTGDSMSVEELGAALRGLSGASRQKLGSHEVLSGVFKIVDRESAGASDD